MNTSTANEKGDAASAAEQLSTLQAENDRMRDELSDLQIMYENMMEHGVAVEDQLADRNIELERMQKRLDKELAEAANYVQSILPAPLTECPEVQWRFVPSSELGGDSFGYHWIDDDHFGIYLLDVCGHGVGAALLSVTAINVLTAGALRNTDFLDPGQVLTNMNSAFDMSKQNEMYFTLWYGVFNRSTRVLRYASGGHPPAMLFSGDGGSASKLFTPQLVIGGMPDVEYTSESCDVPENARLFVFSDGAYEVFMPDGEMIGLEGFETYLARLKRGGDYGLDELIEDLRAAQGVALFEDDFSLLQVDL